MKIITLYEAGSSDGYTTSGEGMFYLTEGEAKVYSSHKHGCFGSIVTHKNVGVVEGEYYLLKRADPIELAISKEQKKQLVDMAMSKLTDDEKKILGLIK